MKGAYARRHRWTLLALMAPMVLLLALPLVALALSASPDSLRAGIEHPLFWPALGLSARTSAISLALIIIGGLPLAWWLATTRSRARHVIGRLVELPIVLPPAVIGIALLMAFGRQGLFAAPFEAAGFALPFTTNAVILAQIIVAAPFFIQAALSAFQRVDADMLLVARTLGASRRQTFFRVAVPAALPGLVGGAALSWARALGEFGATLLFAGNLRGETQTVPLAIISALESDLRAALALALVLAALAVVGLFAMHRIPRWLGAPNGSGDRANSHDSSDSSDSEGRRRP